jgi:hypothetical protein
MNRPRPHILAVSALLVLAPPARAQDGVTAHHLQLGVLAGRIDSRDATVSPLRYGGPTIGARAAYLARGPRDLTEVGMELRGGGLSSARTDGSEDVMSFAMNVAAARRLASNMLLGLSLDGDITGVEHFYAGTNATQLFASGFVTLSPVLYWYPAEGRRRIQVRASVPALAVVVRPYSRTGIQGQSIPWTLVGPSRWRAASFRLHYTSNDANRLAIRSTYQLTVRSYREQSSYAAVENQLSFSALVRLGRLDR